MNEVLQKISRIGIVPVIKIENADQAVPLGKALCEGGLPCAEVTFRTKAAAEAIRRLSKELPQMLVGAGTVLTTAQVDEAVEAGARFIVSPGLNPKVVRYCVERGIPITPGCANPSDVEQAIDLGLEAVKFFPAEAAGGLAMIKAMSAPYGNIKFMPTGGINAKNLNEYLAFPKILACGGSWMVNETLLKEERYDEIARLTREAVHTMLDFKIKHVGVNAKDTEDAMKTASLFGGMLQQPVLPNPRSVFAGDLVEVMSGCGRGTHGHIAISCNEVSRAVAYLESKGIEFNYDSLEYDQKGKMKLIYCKEEIGGFAVHLADKDD